MDGEWMGLAASAAGGGVFGVIGTALGRVAGFFERQQEFRQEQARWEHDAKMFDLQEQATRAREAAELDKLDTSGSWAGLSASLQAEAAIGSSYAWVNAVRALTRPFLTLLLWLITAIVFFNTAQAEQARIVEAALFAATAATLWWFGDRGQRRAPFTGIS